MYIPGAFRAPDHAAMHALMRAAPLATVVICTADGLDANPLPLLLDAAGSRLRGHVARANPLWRSLAGGQQGLAIFHGPDAYVSPNWYPGKLEHGKAVPTWNYQAVHVYGRLRAIDDAGWLRALLTELTDVHEAGQAAPWRLADAPADYVDKLLGAVVGIEFEITRLEGKWKLSQNQPEANRRGVMAGLAGEAAPAAAALAEQMAAQERTRG